MELHRRAWYRRTDEVIVTCDLQKSQYAPSYYLNVGFYLRAFGNETHPKSHECDIVLRGETILGEESEITQLLDLQQSIEDDDRSVRVYTLLVESLTPFITRGATVAGLREMVADGSLPDYMLGANAQTALLPDEG